MSFVPVPCDDCPTVDPDPDNIITCGPEGLLATGGGGSGTSGHTIEDDGTALTQRPVLNFVGEFVMAVDDAAGDETDVTVLGHTHDGTGGDTSLVVGGTNEDGASVPVASSVESIAIGDFAQAITSPNAIAIGSGDSLTTAPLASGISSIAIGSNRDTGDGARASGNLSVAIGGGNSTIPGAAAINQDTIAIGRGSIAQSLAAIAIGSFTQSTTGTSGIAIGAGIIAGEAAQCASRGGIAIGSVDSGTGARAAGAGGGAIAIGGGNTEDGAAATDTFAIALGTNSIASSVQSLALGSFAQATTNISTIAIGSGASLTAGPLASGQSAIAIGANDGAAGIGARATGLWSIAIGSGDDFGPTPGAAASSNDAIAIGRSSNSGISNAIAIGSFATAQSLSSGIAIGGGSNATEAPLCQSSGGIAIGGVGSGTGARVTGTTDGGIAIGGQNNGDGAASTADFAIALGGGSIAAHANAVALGDNVATTAIDQVNIGTKRLFAGTPATAPLDAELIASQSSIWVDEVGDTLTFRVKYADGVTVRTGTVALV